MNARTESVEATAAANARRPQMPVSRTPRIVAAVAAIIVTAWLFEGVASLCERDDAAVHTATMHAATQPAGTIAG